MFDESTKNNEYTIKTNYKFKTRGLLDLIDNKNPKLVVENKKKEEYFSGEIDDLPESVFINIAKELLKEN